VRGALETFAALGRLPDAAARVERELERWELAPLAARRVGHLSKGNLQRLALAQALLGDRALLILDEPLNGLDPLWVARFRRILAAWRAEDPRRTLLIISHNLSELERTVERAAVLVDGRIRSVLEVGGAAPPEPAAGSLEARFLAALREVRA
jgi:ABC-type multidrug transport system ATPase subunit